jgi:hypothetical protein
MADAAVAAVGAGTASNLTDARAVVIARAVPRVFQPRDVIEWIFPRVLPVLSPAPHVGAEPSRKVYLEFQQDAERIIPRGARSQSAQRGSGGRVTKALCQDL